MTEPNEYSKGYQMYKKIHIPDLLNCFEDPAVAMRRLNINWNELSKAEVRHLQSMVEDNKKRCLCFHDRHLTEWFVVKCVILGTILNM